VLAAGEQEVDELVARDAQRLRGRVQVRAVAGLVLDLRHEDRLAPQRRRAGDPVALGLHADDLGVRVLGDLAHEGPAVALGHPVARLDALVRRDRRLERRQQLPWLVAVVDGARPAEVAVHQTASSGAWRRDCTTPKRGATNAASESDALAAGFSAVPWKSEKAADWLTKTPPV